MLYCAFVLYFAYGSNLDFGQMKHRCPSAEFHSLAVLRDHRLAFSRKSLSRGCGVADVVPAPGSKVWGVVYKIAAEEITRLDAAEGFQPGRVQNAYSRVECQVFLNDRDDSPLMAMVYFANREENPPLPNQEYKNQILQGARFWGLPKDYIKEVLEPIPVL